MSIRQILVVGGYGLAVALAVELMSQGVVVAEQRLPIAVNCREFDSEDPREGEDLYPGLDDDQAVASRRNKENSDPTQGHGPCLLG